jgi:hypothetical protein
MAEAWSSMPQHGKHSEFRVLPINHRRNFDMAARNTETATQSMLMAALADTFQSLQQMMVSSSLFWFMQLLATFSVMPVRQK